MKLASFGGCRLPTPWRCGSISRRAACWWRSMKPRENRQAPDVNETKGSMSKVSIVDLEVFYCVGVTDEEREKPQRLLLTIELSFDFSSASVSDRIEKTINYY